MAINEMFPKLPSTGAAQMSDIICAVQGYNAIPGSGTSVQETLSQVYTLFQNNLVLSYPGNPNGNVAGTTYQFCYDTADNILYICSHSGTTSTAVWINPIHISPSNMVWNTVTSSSVTMQINNGYVVTYSGGLCTLTLPSTCSVGDELIIMGLSSGLYTIAQNAGQSIVVSQRTTTSGTGGSLSSTNQYDAITLRCMVTNSVWGTPAGVQAIFTIV